MNEKDWILLVTLNEEHNITKTAERLFISQPALSYRINKLEQEFKSKLFIRNRKGLYFTPQGEYLVQFARRMVGELQETKETIQSMDKEVKGTLKLGVSSTIGRYILPKMLRAFLNHYPDINVNVITGLSSEIEPVLLSSDIHIAIIRGKQRWLEKKMLLKTEPLLAASNYKINMNELPKLNRIYYKTDSSLKDIIDNWWFEKYETRSNITMAVDNLETCKEMVKMGLGYAILPGICLQTEKSLYVEPLLFANGNPVERKTWVYSRDSSMQFAPVKAFFDFFQNYHTIEE